MKALFEKIRSLNRVQWLALLLIVIGVAIMIPKGRGMAEFSREAQFAAENDFAAGNPSTDLLRPWMTIRYIAAAYAVPQEYLFDATQIQPKRETSFIAVNRLNQQMQLGQVNGEPALLGTIRTAIEAYRANPVSPGLLERHVEEWMTVQYIANSTGIPAEELFAAGIPAEGNAYKPLGFLSDELNYPGGEPALAAALQTLVDEKGVKPEIP
jgi:hypothetical protein